ncbi:unnamed protein product [Adineta steineri]|uniref:Uncharacterized protein n=1 Tax=Adineta steineri TaxID=433720 RepID=A0A819SB26_9BILA|nr:unnamed protein product [Adineta steineri]
MARNLYIPVNEYVKLHTQAKTAIKGDLSMELVKKLFMIKKISSTAPNGMIHLLPEPQQQQYYTLLQEKNELLRYGLAYLKEAV